MYLDMRFMGIELEAQTTTRNAFIITDFWEWLSIYASLDRPTRGESWMHVGLDQGIKGAISFRFLWLSGEISCPTLRQKHLNEDREQEDNKPVWHPLESA